MKTVLYTRNYMSYAKGQAAAWPDAMADGLIERGIATEQVQQPDKDTAPVRRNIADKMVRKVAPRKKG